MVSSSSAVLGRPARTRALPALAAASLIVASLLATTPASGVEDDGFGVGYDVESTSEPSSSRVPDAGEPLDLEAAAAGTVTGRILYNGTPSNSGVVTFYPTFNPSIAAGSASTNSDGNYSIAGLPAGQYLVAFSHYGPTPFERAREWAYDADVQRDADTVTLVEGTPANLGDYNIGLRNISPSRVAGSDRFSTAAAISELAWPNGLAGTVFVVNGRNFPDALSAGAAARTGSLLMVEQNSVPAVTRAELTRLDPNRIVVVGGTSVVSNGVLSTLRNYVDIPSNVVRIAGTDRYATSRAVIESTAGLNRDVDALLIATGSNFPDALAAVPAAIVENAAVLLVDGSANRLDSTTRSLVSSLNVPVYIIGGPGAVSSGIAQDLDDLVAVERVAGVDRFDTSVEVALEFFGAADYAFLANGFGFADALAAGPAAGLLQSPTYLVRKECVPDGVYEDIFEVLANRVVSVGGTSVISSDAAAGRPCSTL